MSSSSFKLSLRALARDMVQHYPYLSRMRMRPPKGPTWRGGTHWAHSSITPKEKQLSFKPHAWIRPQGLRQKAGGGGGEGARGAAIQSTALSWDWAYGVVPADSQVPVNTSWSPFQVTRYPEAGGVSSHLRNRDEHGPWIVKIFSWNVPH